MSTDVLLRRRVMLVLLTVLLIVSMFPVASKVHASSPTNLALNTNEEGYPYPSASHTAGGTLWRAINGQFAFDNDSQERWTAWGSSNAKDWFAIEFEEPTTFNQIRLYVYNDGGGVQPAIAYYVQTRIEGCEEENEDNCWLGTTNQTNDPLHAEIYPDATVENTLNIIDFDTITAKNVRIVFTNGNAYPGLVEFEVYNVEPMETFYAALSNEAGDLIQIYVSNQIEGYRDIDISKFEIVTGSGPVSIEYGYRLEDGNTIMLVLSEPLPTDSAEIHLNIRSGAFNTSDGYRNAPAYNLPITTPAQLDINGNQLIEIDDIVKIIANPLLYDINHSGTFDRYDVQILINQILPMNTYSYID